MDTVKMNQPMPESNKCPQCGAPLPANAPAGLCPACLLKAGVAADTVTEPKQPGFNPPSVAELALKFPQLDILELIGKGGMGAVYKARQRQLDRVVALKILPPGIGDDPAFAERFAREAKALAKLNHPGIVTIYDFGQADGLFYFFMEFVDGVNLRQLLHSGRVSAREALAIVPQICDALQYAHDQGIVHRDIKPENIMLDRRGRVKVADFGLAKIIGGETSEPAGSGLSPAGSPVLTESGKVMGTPQYMAPEQKEHPESVDHRADIYALGVVFYQMLTGELPGKKLEPPSNKVRIDVRLDEVVLRALEQKPELRYQQASVLKTQVETITSESTAATSAAPANPAPSKAQRAVSIAANIIAALLVALLGWAACESDIFFNFLFVFIMVMVPVRIALIAWHGFFHSLELGLVRKPFAPGLAKHRLQLLNGVAFWILAALTVEVCMVPAQFDSSQWMVIQIILLGGAAALVLMEFLPGKRVHVATNAVFAIGSIFILSQMAAIYWPMAPERGVTLSAPFHGEWLVVNGGQSRLINIHFTYGNQQEALDIEQLANGHERTGPENMLSSYPSWEQTIYAPADGKVTEVENSLEDNPIGESDAEHPAGNHVVIDIGHGHYVMMAHFKKGSLLVAPGDVVHTGQPVGQCGHSGNTSHPHLHIQVQDQPKFSEAPVATYPIFFQNVTCMRGGHARNDAPYFVRRNDHIINGQAVADVTAAKTGDATALVQDGWQLWQERKWDEAAAKFQQAVQIDPGNANAWNGLGWAQLNGDNSDAGEKSLQKAVSIEPDLPGALNGLGQIYLSERKYDAAEKYLLRAAPKAPAAWYGLARLYLLEGKFDDAGKYAQKVVDSGQGDKTIDKMLEAAKARKLSDSLRLMIEPAPAKQQANAGGYPGDWIWEPNSSTLDRVPPIFLLRPTQFSTNWLPTEMFGRDGYLARRQTVQDLIKTVWSQKNSALKIIFETNLPGDKFDFIITAQPHWYEKLQSEIDQRFNLFEQIESRGGTNVVVVRSATPVSASAETWAPDVVAGGKPDLTKIRDETKTLMEQGSYDEALQRQIWYFNHAIEFGEPDPVRLSFGIMNWNELARRYPKAHDALVEIRDRDMDRFAGGHGFAGLFNEVQSLNHALNDDTATLELFYRLHQQDPQLAGQCYYYVEDQLMQKHEFALCLEYVGDAQTRFESAQRGFETLVSNQRRVAAMRANSPPPNLPPGAKPPLSMGQLATNNFVSQVSKLIEILVANGRQSDAEKISQESLTVMDDPRLKSALGDAEEKIQAQGGQASGNDANEILAEQPPVAVETYPVSGALEVAPGETEIRVRFSKPMTDGSWSWSTAWEDSTPEMIGQPHYLDDHTTCEVKVRLEPSKTYGWWLNSEQFKNFKDRAGQPAVPYLLILRTKNN